MKIKEPKDKYTLIGAVWRYYRHLFNNNCFTVWPDRIAEINKESITFFSLFGPLTVFLCAMHSVDTFLLKLTSVLYTASKSGHIWSAARPCLLIWFSCRQL